MVLKRAVLLIVVLGLVHVFGAPASAQTVLNFPRVISNSSIFTGLAVGNPTSGAASVTFTAYQPDGTLFAAGGVQNPVTLQIPAGGQAAKLFSDLFGASTFNGWIQGTSSTSGLTGFFLNGNFAETDLDGAGAVAPVAQFVLPFAAEDSVAATEITIVNANASAASPTLTLYAFDGSVAATKTLSLPANSLVRQTLTGLFGQIDLSNASHVGVTSDLPVVGHEVVANYLVSGTTVRRETAALSGQPGTASTTYVLPQFATGGGWLSLIGIVNASGVGQEVTLTAYNSDGTVAKVPNNPRKISLDGNASLRTTADQFFGFPNDTLATGWIQIKASLGYVASYIAYGNNASPSFAAVAGTDAASAAKFEAFSQVAQGIGFYTGLTLVNPGTQPASVQFYTLRPDGTTVGQSTFTVQPNQRVGSLFSDILPASLLQVGGWAYLQSSQPIIGAVLFGTLNGDALANVPQQIPAGAFAPPAQTTAAIDGTILSNGQPLANVQVSLSGPVSATASTDGSGHYVFPQLPAGAYVVTAVQSGAQFAPAQRNVTLATQNADGVDFEAGGLTQAGIPAIQFVTPSSTFTGSTALNVRVLGSSFTPVSVVQANGQPLATSFVSSAEIDAILPAAQLTTAGTIQLSVLTPHPGGGSSASVAFSVNPVPSNPLIEGFTSAGSNPSGVAIDAVRHTALVSNQSSDDVYVLDLGTLKTITTVHVGRSPAEGIAIDPSLNLALVANPGSNDVTVIDLTTNTARAQTIKVGNFPVGLAVNPTTHQALVTNANDNNVSIIDLNQLSVTGQILVGTTPKGVAINPTTNQAVVTNSGSNDAWIIDLNNNNILAKVQVKQLPRGVAINSKTNIAVVVNANTNNVSIIDLNSRTVVATLSVSTGPTDVAIHELTNTALVTNSGVSSNSNGFGAPGSVSVIDLAAQTVSTQPITVGSAAFGIGVDQATQEAVVADFGDPYVYVLRVPNPTPRVGDVNPKTFPAGGADFTLDVTGTGYVPTSVVTLNGQTLPTIFVSSTELKATVSAALVQQILQVQASSVASARTGNAIAADTTPFTFTVSVTNGPPGGGNAPPPNNPNVTHIQPQNLQPVLISISPMETTVGQGPVTLTLSGNGFNALSVITFGGFQFSPATSTPTSMSVTIPANLLLAGAYAVSVTNPSPGGGTSAGLTFTVDAQANPAPAISGINPTSVPSGAAATITVQGSGFIAATSAVLGGVHGSVSGSTITFSLSAADTQNPGTLSGLISNPTPGGGSVPFSISVLSVPPTVTGFTPTAAPAGSNALGIQVNGTNFRSGSQITVQGTPIPTQFSSNTQLTGTIPASFLERSGNVHIGVTNPGQGGGSADGGVFAINSSLPTLASAAPGNVIIQSADLTIQLTGTGFVGNSSVAAGTTHLVSVFNSSTSLTVTIPAALLNQAGVLQIVVTNPAPGGGSSAPLNFAVQNPLPVLSGVSPSQLRADQTSVVLTATGSGFVKTSTIVLGATTLTTTFVSATQLTAPLPSPLPLGKLTVTVNNPSPGGGVSAGMTIEVSALAPTISSVTPLTVAAGQAIQITGTNFGPGSSVLLRGQAITTTVASTTSLSATIPANAQPGSADVAVSNPATSTSSAQTSASVTIQITNPAPSISSLDPSSAVAGQSGQRITIHGSGFISSSQIAVNGASVAATFVDASTLTFVLPAISGASSVSVQVTNSAPGGGTANATLALTVPVPTLSSVSPSTGTAGTTVLLTLTGTNFLQGATVNFGSSTVSGSLISSTQLSASVTLGDAGTVTVSVSNPGSAASNTVSFTVVAAPPPPPSAPTLSQISPNSASAGTSGPVTLTGTGFDAGVSAVTVAGTAVTVSSVQMVNSTTATANFSIAANAIPGPRNVTISTAGGTSNAVSFTIVAAGNPSVTGISPLGATRSQSSLTITLSGANLGGISAIQFMMNGVNDPGLSVSGITPSFDGTQATATVTISGSAVLGPHPVQITQNGHTSGSSVTFDVYAAGSPALFTMTPAQGSTGTNVGITITGSSLSAVSGLMLLPQGFGASDPGITVSGLTGSASSLTANLAIAGNALIGPHFVNLNTGNGSTPTNAVLTVSNNGTTVKGANLFAIERGSSSASYTVFGSNLGAVTGLTFYNPDGTVETGIASSAVTASGSSVTASLAVDPNTSIGPHRLILTFTGGVQLSTTLSLAVETSAAQGDIFVSNFGPGGAPAGSSFTMNFGGGGLSALSGFKFQLNGVDDTSLHVSNYQSTGTQASATVTVDSTSTVGTRTMVLIPSAGGALSTNLPFLVSQGPPAFTTSPAGASQGQSNIPITLTGVNLAGTTAIQLWANSANDPGITVTNVTASSDGSQVTGTASFSSTALVQLHSVQITRNGQTYFGDSLNVYAAGTPALYTMYPLTGTAGSTVSITITGASLSNVSGLGFFAQNGGSSDPGITVSGLSASASSLTANLVIGSSASIGPHSVTLVFAASPFAVPTNVSFNVSTSTGTTVTTGNPGIIARGSTVPFSVFGANLGSVTGISFTNPDGSAEPLMTSSGFTASNSSLTANLAVDPSTPVGPRTVVLNFPGGVQVSTTLSVIVETQASQGSIFVNAFGPQTGPPGASFPVSLLGSNPSGITGFKFQVNGSDDTSIQVSGFQTSGFQSTATLAVGSTATLGPRTLVLLLSGGATLTTNFTFTVTGGVPAVNSITPSSGAQGTTVAATIAGTNLAGALNVRFSGTGLTASIGTGGTSTALPVNITIASNAATGTYGFTVSTASGTSAVFTGFSVTPPVISQANPAAGAQGVSNLSVALIGSGTHFTSATPSVSFGTGITVLQVTVNSDTSLTAVINISANASLGVRNVTVTTGTEVATGTNAFSVISGSAIVTSAIPVNGNQNTTLNVVVTGLSTHFVQGTTTASFGAGITVNSVTVTNATSARVNITIQAAAALGARTVTMTTNTEVATETNAFTVVTGIPQVAGVVPGTGAQGTSVSLTVTGLFTNFASNVSQLTFSGSGITVNQVVVNSSTQLTAQVSVASNALPGPRTVTVTTNTEAASLIGGFTVVAGYPTIQQISPNIGLPNTTSLTVAITGQLTHFAAGTTQVSFGPGIGVNGGAPGAFGTVVQVAGTTSATVTLTIGSTVTAGPRDVTIQTNTEVLTVNSGFTVEQSTGVSAPIVVSTSPANGAAGVPINAAYQVTFSAPVDPTSIASGNANLSASGCGASNPVAGYLSVDASGRVLTFLPASVLAVGQSYYFGINAVSSPFIRDQNGHNLNYSCNYFTTGFAPDNTGPSFVAANIANGDASVGTNAPVILGFNKPIDPSTQLSGLKVLQGTTAVAGVWGYNNTYTQATFTPTGGSLAAGTPYTVNFTAALTDSAGNALTNPGTIAFTTGAAADTTQLTLVGFTPPNGFTTGLLPTIRALFSKTIDPLTVTTANSYIYRNSTANAPPTVVRNTTLTVSPDRKSVTINLPGPLDAETSYTWYTCAIYDEAHYSEYCSAWYFTTGGTVDTTAPAVVAVAPPDGATGVPVNAPVQILLSKPIDPTSVGNSSLSLSPAVAGTVSLAGDSVTMTFTPSSNLTASQTYSVRASGFKDLNGNVVTAFSTASGFTTSSSSTPDTSHGSFTQTPSSGATNVPTNASVVFTLSKPANPLTVNTTSVRLYDNTSNTYVSGSITLNSTFTSITFQPAATLEGNHQYCASAGYYSAVNDWAGNYFSYMYSCFTAAAGTDTTPPTIVSVTPLNGATGIGPANPVTVTFSKPMNPSTLSQNVAMFVGTTLYSQSYSSSSDSTSVTFNVGNLSYGTTYAVVIAPGVTDLAGNHPAAQFTSSFTTAPQPATTSPQVTAQRPAPGATQVALNTSISLFISAPLNPSTVNSSSLNIAQNGTLVTGTITLTDNNQVVLFTPAVAWKPGANIQVFFSNAATDASSNPLVNWQASFTTAPDLTSTPPALRATSPCQFCSNVPRNSVIDIQFNKPINPLTATTSNFYIQDCNGNPISGAISVRNNNTVVRFAPSTLPPATCTYFTVYVTSGITDTNNLAFSGTVWNNSYSSTVDTTAPAVSMIAPTNNAANIGVNAAIRVTFSKPVEPLTVDGSSITVVSNSATIPMSVSFDGTYTTVTLTPQSPLPGSAQITVSVNANVTDQSGNPATPSSSVFSTAAGPDFAGPVVISSTVANGQTNVPITSVFTLTFNKPIDTRTAVLNSTVWLYDYNGTGYVPAALSFGGNGAQLTIQPNAVLSVGHTFYLETCTIQDLNGNTGQCAIFSFSTALTSPAGGPQVSFALPLNGQAQVPTNFKPQIQFDRPIDPSSVGSITLTQGSTPVRFTTALTVGSTVATLSPAALLLPNSSYTLTISGVKDPAGSVMSGSVVRNFTTGASIDLTAPGTLLAGSSLENTSVYATTPQSSATTGTQPIIRTSFTKPVNPLATSGWSLYNSGRNQYVPGVGISFAANLLSATITYPGSLDPNTQYCYYFGSLSDLAGNFGSGSEACFTTSAGLDTTAPAITLSTPPNGTQNVPTNALVAVRTTKPIDATTINANSLMLSPAPPTGTTVQLAMDYQTVYLYSGANTLSPGVTYTITVNANGFADYNGNAVTAFSSTFTTGSSTDTTHGTIALTSPAPNATGVSTSTSMVANFSKPLDPATVTPDAFRVYAGNNAIAGGITGSISATTSSLTFTPAAPLPANTTISVYVGYWATVYDLATNSFNSLYAQFTTGSGPADAAPTVSMTPASGSTGIGPNAVVTLTFSKSIDPNTVNQQNFALFNGSTNMNAGASISSDNRTVTFNTTLPYGATITAVVSTAVKDLAGTNLANPFQSSFTTLPQPLPANPSILQSRPANGASGVPLNSSITLFASSPLNPSTVSSALFVSQNGVLISGTTATSTDGLSVTFTPTTPYSAGATMQVFLNGATDTAGNVVRNFTATFTTVTNVSAAAATLIASTPSQYSSGNVLNTLIELQFSKAINPATVSGTTFYVQTSSSVNVGGTISQFNNNTALRFTPSAPLSSSSTYYVYWTSGLQDSNSLALAGSYFDFFTGTASDSTTPSIASMSPAQSATGIGANAVIHFTFNKAMDPLSVNSSNITLSQGSQPIPYSIAISGPPTSVTLTPQSPLPAGSTMTLALTAGIQDSAGHALAPQTVTFTTASGSDFNAPSVIQSSIGGSPAPPVPVNSSFVLVFSKPLDPASIASNQYYLYDYSTGTVPTTVTLSADGRIVTFTPTGSLTAGHTYYLSAYYATDLNGNQQIGYSSSSFTAVASDTAAPLVVSSNPNTSGATGVPVNVLMELQFNKAVRGTSLSQVTLQGPNAAAVPFTTQMLYGSTVVQLIPAVVLAPSTTYTVTAAGVQSIAGIAMSGSYSYTFTTGSNLLLTSTPNVVSATAGGTALSDSTSTSGIPDNPAFVITLDSPVEPGSINSGGVVLVLSSNTNTLSSLNFSLSADQKTITATLPAALAAGTTYRLRVSYNSYLRDWAGNRSFSYYDYVFTTQ